MGKVHTPELDGLINKHFQAFNEPGTRLGAFSFFMATGTVNGTFLCAIKDIISEYSDSLTKQLSDLQAENERLKEVAGKMYMTLYGGNSVSIEDAMNRAPKGDQFEQEIISVLRPKK